MAGRLAALLVSVLLAGCRADGVFGIGHPGDRPDPATAVERASDLGRTFENAVLLVPDGRGGADLYRAGDSGAAAAAAAQAPAGGFPTVLYLHGCTGFPDASALRPIAAAGYLVVAPDSFARAYRPAQCVPSLGIGGRHLFVYDFRQAEIGYALERLRDVGWVDAGRLALLGESEGGLAAALYRGDDFRGRAILAWTCQGRPLVRGLAAPAGEPVLAVVRADDPWYQADRTEGQSGDCGAFMRDRPLARSVVLPPTGRHDVLTDPATLPLLLEFFGRTIGPAAPPAG